MTAVDVLVPTAVAGGAEHLGALLSAELRRHAGVDSRLLAGPRQIVSSRLDAPDWVAVTWKTFLLAAAAHPRRARAGSVWALGAELVRDRSPVVQAVRARVLERARRCLALSPTSVDLLPAGERERARLVGPAVGTSLFEVPLETGGPAGDATSLVSIGRLVARKGHDTAIDVASVLAEDGHTTLTIVGAGPDEPRLRELARRSPAQVVFAGRVDEATKSRLLVEAAVVLFLSRPEGTEFEGLGLVPLEANAVGRPVVVRDNGGSRWSVSDGLSGRLVPADGDVVADSVDAVREARSGAFPPDRCRAWASHFHPASWSRRVVRALYEEDYRWEWPAWTPS